MRRRQGDNGLQPLSESTYCILLCLSEGPLHGYAIRERVRTISDGRLQLSTGTLYGALQRFLDLHWIQPVARKTVPAEESTRTRREYRLTKLGMEVLAAETRRLRRLVDAAVRLQPARSVG